MIEKHKQMYRKIGMMIAACSIAAFFTVSAQPVTDTNKINLNNSPDKLEGLKPTGSDYSKEKIKQAFNLSTAHKKATEWVASLKLENPVKEKRVIDIIADHLTAVDDWVKEHPYTQVPAGINPLSGKALNEVDRKVIANSAIAAAVHNHLMSGLRQELSEAQVDSVLDLYTIGKVAFTMKAYREIIPDITPTEDSTLLSLMKQAREQAIDYSGMKQVSAIFEIYKTKAEQYLNTHGRNWRQIYSNYTALLKARKAAENKTGSPNP